MSVYIANISYGIWRGEIWFQGKENRGDIFSRAVDYVSDCAEKMTFMHSGEFFDYAVSVFEEKGFFRIEK